MEFIFGKVPEAAAYRRAHTPYGEKAMNYALATIICLFLIGISSTHAAHNGSKISAGIMPIVFFRRLMPEKGKPTLLTA